MQIGKVVRQCALLAVVAACVKTDSPAVMDDSTFVAAMARLHVIERKYELTDAARDSLRRSVLQEQGLTLQRLEQQARHYADEPRRASAIWIAINQKALQVSGDSAAPANRPGAQTEQTR
jgi:hypothetical protein